MSKDPFAEQSARLLAALDFGEEAAARERQHRRELAAILGSLLAVMDSFDRLLVSPVGGSPESRGELAVPARSVELVARQLARCLEGVGVVPLDCLGAVADPEVHEIAGVRHGSGAGRDAVVEVLERGYLWNGTLLRRPRVIVAVGDEGSEQ